MNKLVLDTNAFTAYLAGDKNVLAALAKANTTFLSIFVLGELYAGFMGGTKKNQNIDLLQTFLDKPRIFVLNASTETAEIFGYIKHLLKEAGTTLPINDVWIASHTMETGATIITYDKHFTKVPGLRIWRHLIE